MSSIQDLKSLIEQSEYLKDQVRSKAVDVKYSRSTIRDLKKDLQNKSDQISHLEKNSSLFKKKKIINSIPAQELEYYNTVFSKTISPIFTTIPFKSKKPKIQINVNFLSSRISFFVSQKDTFLTLRQQVSSYWALPLNEVYFSDTRPEEGQQAVFILTDNVIKELYVWNKVKLKDQNFELYLVLNNYSSLKDRIEEVFPQSLCDETITGQTEVDIGSEDRLKKRKKVEKSKQDDKINDFKSQKMWHKVQYGIQWGLYFGLFLLWGFMLGADHDTMKITWMNKAITDTLLWNYSFDDQKNFNIFGDINNEFLSVTSLDDIWEYIMSLQSKLTSSDIGVLNNNIYVLKYVEIRQLRTSYGYCSYEGVLNFTCSDMYSLLNKDEKSFGKKGYQIYTDRDDLNYVYADFAMYPNSGFINHLDIEDAVGWKNNITNLINSNWIAEGTRAVFITINFYNPDSEIFSMVMPYFEILPSQVFVPGFKLYSFKAHVYSGVRIVSHFFIFVFLILLLVLEVKQNTRHPKEVQTFIYEKNNAEVNILDEISAYNKKSIFWRLKKPGIDSSISILTLLSTLILEIISLSMYLGEFNASTEIQWNYMDLFGKYQRLSMLNDAKCLVSLFISVNMIRYIIILLSKANDLFRIILKVFSQIGFYFFLALMPVLLFSIFFFYFLGIVDYNFSTLDRSFVSTIRMFCGKWPTDRSVLYFVNSGYLALLIFIFLLWKTIAINIQSTIFQHNLSKLAMQRARQPR